MEPNSAPNYLDDDVHSPFYHQLTAEQAAYRCLRQGLDDFRQTGQLLGISALRKIEPHLSALVLNTEEAQLLHRSRQRLATANSPTRSGHPLWLALLLVVSLITLSAAFWGIRETPEPPARATTPQTETPASPKKQTTSNLPIRDAKRKQLLNDAD